MGPQPLRGLKASQKINVITGFFLVIALFVMYLTTLHIDGLARSRYSVQSKNLYAQINVQICHFNHVSAGHHSVGARSVGDPRFNVMRRAKVHTKVIEGKLDKTYRENINATLEYIFQYVYSLPSDNALSVRVESLSATKDNPVLVVVRQQAGILSWQLPFILESSSIP